MWPESDIGFERAGRNWLSRGECVPPASQAPVQMRRRSVVFLRTPERNFETGVSGTGRTDT